MIKQQRGRGSKYTDDFKRQLVAESRADDVSVAMISIHLVVADEHMLTIRQIADSHWTFYNHLAKVRQWLVRD